MRQFAALAIGMCAFAFAFTPVSAQQTGDPGTATQESVTFVLELDDSMIEALKRGEPLKSQIPAHLRNKVTEVRLRYIPPVNHVPRTAERPLGNSSTFPSGTQPANTGTQRSGIGNGTSGSTMPPFQPSNGSGTRSDSNRYGGSANSLLQGGQTDSIGTGTRGDLPGAGVPRFTPPTRSTNGNPTNSFPGNGQTNGSMINRHERPLGPPSPFARPSGNSGSTIRGLQDNSTFQPASRSQPANTNSRPPTGNYIPNPTQDNNLRPVSPRGNQFDTVGNQTYPSGITDRTHQPETAKWVPPAERIAQHDDSGYRPVPNESQYGDRPTQDRFASRQWENNQPNGYRSDLIDPSMANQDTRNTYQPFYQNPQRRDSQVMGHDNISMIPNPSPRIAARPEYQRAGFQNQNTTSQGQQDYSASIPGNKTADDEHVAANDGPNGSSPVSQLNQFNKFLYFFLLCSIGLNIYLAWISRGFYVRYRELADELRDTFSTV